MQLFRDAASRRLHLTEPIPPPAAADGSLRNRQRRPVVSKHSQELRAVKTHARPRILVGTTVPFVVWPNIVGSQWNFADRTGLLALAIV